jgi:hypothetical protein
MYGVNMAAMAVSRIEPQRLWQQRCDSHCAVGQQGSSRVSVAR